MKNFSKNLAGTQALNSKLSRQELAEKKFFEQQAQKPRLSFGSVVEFDGQSFVVRAVLPLLHRLFLVSNKDGSVYFAAMNTQHDDILAVGKANWPTWLAVKADGKQFQIDNADRNRRNSRVRAVDDTNYPVYIKVRSDSNGMLFVC